MAALLIFAPLCIAAGAILPPVCAALVALRFWSRKRQHIKLGADDWLTLPALVLIIGASVALLYGVSQRALGYHTPPPPPGVPAVAAYSPQLRLAEQIWWATELMQIPALAAIKISIVLFFRRVFVTGSNRVFGFATIAIIALVLIWAVGFFFAMVFICPGNPSAYWSPLIELGQHCSSTVQIHNSYAITDFLLDVPIILIPIAPVLKLQMSSSRKFAVLGVFGLGALSIVASIVRLAVYVESTKITASVATSDFDMTYTSGIYWCLLETSIALMSACLPTIYGSFRRKNKRDAPLKYHGTPELSNGGTGNSRCNRDLIHKKVHASVIELEMGKDDCIEVARLDEITVFEAVEARRLAVPKDVV